MFTNIKLPGIFKQKNSITAFISTLLIGLFTHIYKFTNYLPNNDSPYNVYARQNIVQSGRWFLEVPATISSNFDLPWVTGLLSIIYIALAAVVLINLFNIENKVVICIVGGILAAYPSVTAIFFFGYTADAYMIGLLFAVCAVYLSRFGERRKSRLIFSVILLCLSCAIYQAFFSFGLVLIIVYFIFTVLTSDINLKKAWQFIIKQAIIVVLAFALYYIIWTIVKQITDINSGEYLGIETAGLSITGIISGLKSSVSELLYFFTESNLSKTSLTFYAAANVIILVSTLLSIIVSIIKSKIYKSFGKLITVLGALVVSYPCVVMFNLVSSEVSSSTRMLMNTSLFIILTVLLINHYFNIHLKNLYGAFMIAVVFNYIIMANVGYFTLNRSAEASKIKAAEMMTQIHTYQNNYDIEQIAFVGEGSNNYPIINPDNINTKEKTNYYRNYQLLAFGGDLLFDDSHAYYYLTNYCGLDLGYVNRDEMLKLSEIEEVKKLDVWPSENSFTVVDKTLVIRLSDNENYWWNNTDD